MRQVPDSSHSHGASRLPTLTIPKCPTSSYTFQMKDLKEGGGAKGSSREPDMWQPCDEERLRNSTYHMFITCKNYKVYIENAFFFFLTQTALFSFSPKYLSYLFSRIVAPAELQPPAGSAPTGNYGSRDAPAPGSSRAVPTGSAGRARPRSMPVRVVPPAAEPQVAPRGPAPSPGRLARGGAGRGRAVRGGGAVPAVRPGREASAAASR